MRYRSKRHYIWSNNTAYLAGLIASDGCLQSDGRHIDLTSKDLEQIHNFIKAVGRELPVSTKLGLDGKVAFRCQFSDVALYDFLFETGITPNKSQTISSVDVPAEYYPDFLRGLFDGDGSCWEYHDKRWKSSHQYYSSFSSASKVFLEFIRDKNEELIGIQGASIRLGKGAYILTYAKKSTIQLCEYIYYTENVLALSRKRLKLSGFINAQTVVE